MIEDVIARLASNSFALKGWAVTLVVAIFGLTWDNVSRGVCLIALLPVLAFWGLDAYYLGLERRKRKLYNKVREMDEEAIDFNMSTSGEEFQDQKTCFWNCLWSKTERRFYLPLLVVVLALVVAPIFPQIMEVLGYVPKT